jgi:hypothetical protein
MRIGLVLVFLMLGAFCFEASASYSEEQRLRDACEFHKDADSCLSLAKSVGMRGLEEVADGYARYACRIDTRTCKVLEAVLCMKKKDKAGESRKECTQGNPFFKQDGE